MVLQHIMDERYAAIDVVGKGLVIFSSSVALESAVYSYTDLTTALPVAHTLAS